jgi:predicted  nucleic acid-binding Zn-ribbon protein
MDDKSNMEILLEIQNTLGTVVEATSSIKKDIIELKEKDVRQSDDLEKAYAKAKARQDSIRDDLQHQIDNNHQLISDIKSSIDSLTLTISGIIEESKNNAERIIKENLEKYDEKFEKLTTKVTTLENEKKNKVYSRWEKISDKIFWIIVAIVFAAVFKYLNFTPPKMPV